MTFSVFEMLLLLVPSTQSIARTDTLHGIPFDTTLAVANSAHLAIELGTGGTLRIIGGESKSVRVHVGEQGRHCADCAVAVTHSCAIIHVRTRRGTPASGPAELEVEIEVPIQCNIDLSSAGGRVEIEGVDGSLSGTTEFGALSLRRISGAVELLTRRGDVTLRESYVSGSLRTLDGRVLFEDVGGSVQGTSAKGRVIMRRVERTDSRG